MSRRPREDVPGSLHHVYDRGVARRPIFDSAQDARYLLSRIARAHRSDLLRVHAYSLKANHYHFLVSTLQVPLGVAMLFVKGRYVRVFNSRHDRDGPLFRSRFNSRRVTSDAYLINLIRYIDNNALPDVDHPGQYAFGSASHYLRGDGPKWLSRDLVEAIVMGRASGRPFDPDAYRAFLGVPLTEAEREIVECRMSRPAAADDPTDQLVGAETSRLAAWLSRRAVAADGSPGRTILVPPAAVDTLIALERTRFGDEPRPRHGQGVDRFDLAQVGLLRDLCGLSFQEIAARLDISRTAVRARHERHAREMAEGKEYAGVAAGLANAVLRETFPHARLLAGSVQARSG